MAPNLLKPLTVHVSLYGVSDVLNSVKRMKACIRAHYLETNEFISTKSAVFACE